MSELEESIRMHVNAKKWIKLKMFDEHQIAVCLYHPYTEEKNKFIVQAYRVSEAELPIWGLFEVKSLTFTERKFKKKDRKIAKWYFRELSQSLKNGILNPEKSTERSRRRWG